MKNYTWWTKPNQEGVSNRDMFQVMTFGLLLFGFLATIWYFIKS